MRVEAADVRRVWYNMCRYEMDHIFQPGIARESRGGAMIISPLDNVEVREDGHKYALRAIAAGENVIKYGMPIGHATKDIAAGEHVHVHNVKTNLGDVLEYAYDPSFTEVARVESPTPYADTLIPIRLYGWRTAGEATLSNPIESACDESVPA